MLELLVVHLAGEALELSSRFLGLLGQLPLGLASSRRTALALLGPAALRLRLLLLPARELLELLQQLVDLVVGLLLLAPLNRLVLVLELVELELEEVGEVLGGLLLTAAAAATALLLLLRDVALVGLLGLLQVAERLLLVRQGLAQLLVVEVLLGALHRLRRPREDRGDVAEAGVGVREPAVLHALEQGRHLVAETALGERHAHHVLAELLGIVAVALADQVERRRDHLALELGERRVVLLPALLPAASAASAHLLGLAIRALEGAHVQEVDVAADDLVSPERAVVAHEGVVRDEIAGLELPLLQEERVARGDLGQGSSARLEDRDRVLRAPVDRVDQADVTDPVVVRGPHLEVDLLDRGGGHVPPRPTEVDGGLEIGEDVDVVLRRCGHELAGRARELDRVEAVLADREPGGEGAVLLRLQLGCRLAVEQQLPPRRHHGRLDGQLDDRARQGGDVARVLDGPR